MMAKIRIKDLATELGVIYGDLAAKATADFGVEITGPMSLIDDEVAEKIREAVKEKGNGFKIEEKRVASKVIRRRRVKKPDPAPPEPEAVAKTDEVDEESAVEAKAEEKAAKEESKAAKEETKKAKKPKKAAADDDSKRKKSFQALKVVEERSVEAPEVRDAPVFATPEPTKKPAKVDNRPPEVIAREEAAKEEHSGRPPKSATADQRGKGRREFIEVRQIIPKKQFGKRKAAAGKKGKKTEITTPKASKRIIRISESVTVGELAKNMSVKVGELIGKAVGMGLMVTINQSLDAETAAILASEFNYEVENVAIDAEEMLLQEKVEAGEEMPRPPVITVMGHVDHGKTSLLDYIRKTNVTSKEHGGITQHIGAYKVDHPKGQMVFLDTPGHEAFTAMRARGTSVTDIAIIVCAADDGVMPQTKESINHAKAAEVPIIVAINKMDKPEANPERVKQQLTEVGLVPEAWGGDVIFTEVSAHSGQGIDELLDMVMLQAEVMELKADPKRPAKGIIVESKLDKGRGPVATVLIQVGTLKVGNPVVCGFQSGRVRTLVNDRGERVKEAGPATPVEVVGLSGVVEVGDELVSVSDEKKARQVSQVRQEVQRKKDLDNSAKVRLDNIKKQIEEGEALDLNVVLKGDVKGSVEAIAESIAKLADERVATNIIHSAVGGITESDVMLASASNALVIGFNVRPENAIKQLAEKEGVEIRLYSVIYDLVEDIKKAMEGLLAPKEVENVIGHVEVKQTFAVSKVGTIGGGVVTDGKISRSARVRLLRDSVIVYEGKLKSLKRFKDDVKEVKNGLECGFGIENFNDLKVGDIVEVFEVQQVNQEL